MAVHIDEGALRSSLQRLRQAAFDADVVTVMKRTVNAVHGVFGYGAAVAEHAMNRIDGALHHTDHVSVERGLAQPLQA